MLKPQFKKRTLYWYANKCNIGYVLRANSLSNYWCLIDVSNWSAIMLDIHRRKLLLNSVVTGLLALHAGLSVGEPIAKSYCDVESSGSVLLTRPQADEAMPYINDVNWFARPVPNPNNDFVIAFASHNQNYLYNLSSGKRVAIPDTSDAVATPDGRFITVPSHYTPDHSINFYEADELLGALDEGRDARDTKAVFSHKDENVFNTFYQSVGVLHSSENKDQYDVKYRMMFSGSLPPTPPGFLIADYDVSSRNGEISFSPSPVLRLCPEIIDDMATPFISKDGRYIVAHDNSDVMSDSSLKLFEITGVDYKGLTTSCKQIIDFGFKAGKADFSFDNSKITFHLSSNDYITSFISGGIDAPHITDVVVANLEQDENGSIVGFGSISRLTTSKVQGVGNYFPAFFPGGELFYIANSMPRTHPHFDIGNVESRRFQFHVIDPKKASYQDGAFQSTQGKKDMATIGRLWKQSCTPGNNPLSGDKSAWNYMSMNSNQCSSLINDKWQGDFGSKQQLLKQCQKR